MAVRPPILSVCVPTYDRPELLVRTIRSIVDASGPASADVEIVVSDNSPDLTETIARDSLAAWTGRTLYLANRPDIGMVHNFNQCVARASGEYVLLLHDDDSLLPGALPAILASIAAAGAGTRPLLFGVHVVDEAGDVRRRQEFAAQHDLKPRHALRRLLSDSSFVRFPAIVVRRATYDQVGPFDPEMRNAVDLDMWVRLFARDGVRCVPATISRYSVHAGASTTTMFNRDSIVTLLKIFDRARATKLLSDATVRRCEVDFFHQFTLGGARAVMALFAEAQVLRIGWSARWLPIRAVLALMVRVPPRLSRRVIDWVVRQNLEQPLWMIR